MLAVVPEDAAAEVFFRVDVAAGETEVVVAVIADEPGIEASRGGTVEREEMVGGVFDAGSVAESTLAEVVEVEVPLHSLGPIDAEDLEPIELEESLEAEDFVLLNADVVDVVRRLLEVG
jgi:hypothetical protein